MADEVLAWERQPGETEEEWDAFRAYRDQLPPRRMMHAVVKSTAKVSRWYNANRWAERTAAYDRHLDAIVRSEREKLLAETTQERAAKQIAKLQLVYSIVDRELRKLEEDSRKTSAFGLVKVNDLNKLLANAITLERLIRGESTENKAVVDVNLDALSVEELRQYRELQEKALAKAEESEPDADTRH
jgi:hypothetical protein